MTESRLSMPNALRAGIPPAWLAAYLLLLGACFLLFQQLDLYWTSASSYAYLNGHIADFYDHNKPLVRVNDYLPLVYAIFAAWNLPLKVLGLMSDISADGAPPGAAFLVLTPLEVAWTKLLVVVAFAACVVWVKKIATSIAATDGPAIDPKLPAVLFATSPIAVFAVFIFGQYDVVGLAFALAGFHALIGGRSFRGAFLFSVAASFKFFAFVVLLPLVLLLEKRLLRIAALGLAGASVTLLQLALYWHSPVFRADIFSHALRKAQPLGEQSSVFGSPMFYLGVVYLGLCVAAYLYRPERPLDRVRAAVLVPIAAWGLMFSAVVWHPQWIILITPFFALAAVFIQRRWWLIAADALGAVALIWISVNMWRFNVDSTMLTTGPLKQFFPFVYTGLFSFLPDRLTPLFKVIFYSYLFVPLILVLADRFAPPLRTRAPGAALIAARLVVGVGIFVIPALGTAWMPRDLAIKLDGNAAMVGLAAGPVFAESEAPVGEIHGAHRVVQHFVPAADGLKGVGVRLATYARRNSSTLHVRLLDDTGAVIAETAVPASKVDDSMIRYFEVPVQSASAGRAFALVLESPDARPGNALTAWMGPRAGGSEAGDLEVAGIKKPGVLVMRLFYANQP